MLPGIQTWKNLSLKKFPPKLFEKKKKEKRSLIITSQRVASI